MNDSPAAQLQTQLRSDEEDASASWDELREVSKAFLLSWRVILASCIFLKGFRQYHSRYPYFTKLMILKSGAVV